MFPSSSRFFTFLLAAKQNQKKTPHFPKVKAKVALKTRMSLSPQRLEESFLEARKRLRPDPSFFVSFLYVLKSKVRIKTLFYRYTGFES